MTDKLRAAAEAALEALVIAEAGLADIGDADREPGDDLAWCEQRAAEALDAPRKAIALLRAALVEPVQEPVAWMDIDENGNRLTVRQWSDGNNEEVPLYTTPPRREWVGLTDEERRGIREHQRLLEELGPVWSPMLLYYYLAIESALKEKNGA